MSLSTRPFRGPLCNQNIRLLSALLAKPSHPSQPHRLLSSSPPPGATPTPDPSPSTSTVSPAETSHFSSLSSTWWDPHGPSRLLHLMNPLRHTFLQSLQCPQSSSTSSSNPSPPNSRTYLDVGCGGGIFSSSAARLPTTRSVLGIDPTPSQIAIAQAHARTDPALAGPKLTYLNAAVEDLPLPSGISTSASAEAGPAADAGLAATSVPADGFDVVTIFEVLEHVSYASVFLGECARRVKVGGWLVGSTIARSWPAWVTAVLVAEMPVFGVVPRGTHRWERFVLPGEVEGWFAKRGRAENGMGERWGEVRVQGVMYVPGLGWRVVPEGLGGEGWGNYFFGVQRLR